MTNDARLTIALPKTLMLEIKETAKERGISQAAFIKIACVEYMKKVKK